MYKAEHEQLFQEANQGLIEIRKQEIDFYLRVNSALGTQAALIVGFVYLTFTQNLDYHYVWTVYVNAIYFCASAVTMALATHVILCTMLVQILGPGLALNGPIGSMARATEGMKIEQKQIVRSFFCMMGSFSITTVLLFWVTMDFYSSIVSTAFFIYAARQWGYYCGRIRNRFFWVDKDNQAGSWHERSSRDSSTDEPTVHNIQMRVSNQQQLGSSPLHGHNGRDVETGGPFSEDSSHRGSLVGNGSRPSFSGKFVERMSFIMPTGSVKPATATTQEGSMSNGTSQHTTRTSIVTNLKDIIVEGFVTMNVVSELKKKFWERRYVVVNYKGQMTYYKNRQDYRTDPIKSAMGGRPLELDEYYIKLNKQESFSDTSSVSAAGDIDGVVAKFVFSLTRKDDPSYTSWHYKLDTEEELDMWVAAMRVVSPTSFKATTTAAGDMA